MKRKWNFGCKISNNCWIYKSHMFSGVGIISANDESIDINRIRERFDTVSEENLEKGATYLIKRIPKEEMNKIKVLIKQNPAWEITNHHGLGTYIRNLLREGSFNDPFLDDKWAKFLSKAIEYSD